MAENDNAEDLELEDPEDAPEIADGEEDTTDYKALAAKNAGIAKRNKTKLEKLKLKNAERRGADKQAAKEANKQGFDYAEKAYLKSSGIASSEFALVEEFMSDTGKSLDDVLENKRFQAELKAQRDEVATSEATPTGSKRAAGSTRDSVEYWVAKGGLPADNPELSRKVVKARIKAEQDKTHFTSKSVV